MEQARRFEGRAALVTAMGVLAMALTAASDEHSADAAGRDLAVIAERIVAGSLTGSPGADEVGRWLAAQADDGSWPDVDYTVRSRTHWTPLRHVERLTRLARAYLDKAHPRCGDAAMRKAMVRGLEYWIRTDPKSTNWWWNVIATPRALGTCLLLVKDHVPQDLVARSQPILDRAWEAHGRLTAQNRVWVARNALVQACLTDNADLARRAVGAVTGTVRVTDAEGIQADWSFHQHGPQLYSGGYGMGFADDCSAVAALVRGTQFAFTGEQVATLSHYLLDGQQWMALGPAMDPSVMGREIVRGSAARRARRLADVCRRMADLHPQRRDAHLAFVRRIEGDAAPLGNSAPAGNRHFWRSDFMVHRGPGHYASVRMSSARTLPSETVNSENLLGWHLGDGATYFMCRGDEYARVYPVWDWRRVPGVTSRLREGDVPPLKGGPRNRSDFVGGVSDGRAGLAAMDCRRDDVRARKAWLCLPGGQVVAMAAGIRTESDDPLVTTIDQRPRVGPLAYDAGRGTLTVAAGTPAAAEEVRWVRHDGFDYAALDGSIRLTSKVQEGSWRRISKPQSAGPVRRGVLTLWIEHGRRPDGARCAYTVTPEAIALPGVKVPPRVLSNAERLQAVWIERERLLAVAFYEPGSVEAAQAGRIDVDKPCLVLWNTRQRTLAVSDPTQKLRQVNVALRGHDEARGKPILVELPTGMAAGSSVVRPLGAGPGAD